MTGCCATIPRVLGTAQGDRFDGRGAAQGPCRVAAAQAYDVVVVDEAHHLKDQSSASYHLVNSLQKRFLLLLSATPCRTT